jgi:hypothetical protein
VRHDRVLLFDSFDKQYETLVAKIAEAIEDINLDQTGPVKIGKLIDLSIAKRLRHHLEAAH